MLRNVFFILSGDAQGTVISSPKKQRLAVIAVLLGWCSTLLAFRVLRTDSPHLFGLWWNLFLALIPLLCSSTLPTRGASTRVLKPSQLLMLGVWLLFLPNAPYILTDLIHLDANTSPKIPQWFDLALLLSFAGAGLFFCYLSLLDVQTFLSKKFGALFGWSVAAISLMLCGFGIYLGRFLRWNSWDFFTNPHALLSNIPLLMTNRGNEPNPFAVTLIYGIGLIVGYMALRVAATSMTQTPGEHDER
jgi:uncharacterized membrane protein